MTIECVAQVCSFYLAVSLSKVLALLFAVVMCSPNAAYALNIQRNTRNTQRSQAIQAATECPLTRTGYLLVRAVLGHMSLIDSRTEMWRNVEHERDSKRERARLRRFE